MDPQPTILVMPETTPTLCKCGCGLAVPRSNRAFVDKSHQLDWMAAGGAAEMNEMQPIEAKRLGGHVAGSEARDSGRLADAGLKGAERAAEITREWKARQRGDA
jgi:general stress protein YciG